MDIFFYDFVIEFMYILKIIKRKMDVNYIVFVLFIIFLIGFFLICVIKICLMILFL